jgi:hypothetical protein
VPPLAVFKFAADQINADPYSTLVSLGPVGIILILMIWGKLRTEGEVKRLEEENKAKDEKISALTESAMGQVIPLMVRVASALDKLVDASLDRQERPK